MPVKVNYYVLIQVLVPKVQQLPYRRWVKPKINYHERLCTLCDENDIEDEYHILMKCNYFVNLREKYISKKYYKRPSMYEFQKLMNTTKRELY